VSLVMRTTNVQVLCHVAAETDEDVSAYELPT